jgi:hypothetical protein
MDNCVLKTTWYSFHPVTLDKFLGSCPILVIRDR